MAMTSLGQVASSNLEVFEEAGDAVESLTPGQLLWLAPKLMAFFYFAIFSNIFFTSKSISVANQGNIREEKKEKEEKILKRGR